MSRALLGPAAAVAVAALLSFSISSHAQSPLRLVVSTSADGPDASPGDGVCDDGTGDCTLRAAVDEANAAGGAVVIVLPGRLPGGNTGAYTLSEVAPNTAFNTYEDANEYGDLDLNGSFGELTIQGTGTPGPKLSISPNDRILDIGAGKTVRIERVWLTGGTARAGRNGNGDGSGIGVDAEDGADGGGIRVGDGATLTLDQVTISGCFTQSGGNGATPASSISRTTGGDAGDGGDGGAIYIGMGATVDIRRSNITGNGTGDAGGAGSGQANGMAADGGAGGDGGNGGAIYNAGTLSVTNSTIYNNSCGDAGAGGAGVNGGSAGSVGGGGAGGNIANAQEVGGSVTNQGTATLTSTIVAGGSAGSSVNSGPIAGDDLFDATDGGTFSGNNNFVGTSDGVPNVSFGSSQVGPTGSTIDPVITGQNQNGDWAVPTLVLGSGSPAIDQGVSDQSDDFDARGYEVPGNTSGSPDIGAYEANSSRMPQEVNISEIDVKTSSGDGEFVEVTNPGNYPLQLDDHAIVVFDEAGNACFTANLYGELAPGMMFTVGDVGTPGTVDQDLTFDVGQDACGGASNDQFKDGDGALAIYFGRAPNLSGIPAGSQPNDRKDAIAYNDGSSSGNAGSGGGSQSARAAAFDFCSAFGQGSGCEATDPGDDASIQRDGNGDLYTGLPSPGSVNSGVSVPLPVEWLGVRGYATDAGEVHVTWTVAREVDVADYRVQVLENAEWATKSVVAPSALDDAGVTTYAQSLGVLPAGTYTLRVEQRDYDGTADASALVSVTVSGRGVVTVSPNPFRDRFEVRMPTALERVGGTPAVLQITDAQGRRVLERTLDPSAGERHGVSLEGFPAGFYSVRVLDGAGVAGATSLRVQKL